MEKKTDYRYQPLFDHMLQEHGLTLLESEMADIIHVVEKMRQSPPQGAVWVKGAKGFPVKKLVVAKMFVSYLNKEVVGTASSATGEMIVFDWVVSAVCLPINHEELNNLTWLDESGTPAKESDAVDILEFAEWAAQIGWFDEEYHLWNFYEEGKMVDGRFRFSTSEFYELFKQSK